MIRNWKLAASLLTICVLAVVYEIAKLRGEKAVLEAKVTLLKEELEHNNNGATTTTTSTSTSAIDTSTKTKKANQQVNQDKRDETKTEKKDTGPFRDKLFEAIEFCTGNNYVAPWAYKTHIDRLVPSEESARNFSLQRQHFEPNNNKQPECTTVTDLLQAVRNGRRQWNEPHLNTDVTELVNPQYWEEQEVTPSRFFPDQCDIPLLSPDQMCDVLGQFSHILFLGDSLERHMYMALVSAVKNDLIRGFVQDSDQALMREKCYCDGQFSEHEHCRLYTPEMMSFHAPDKGFCSQQTTSAMVRWANYAHKDGPAEYRTIFSGIDCSQPDNQGLLLILQGGLHFEVNARNVFTHFRDHMWPHPHLVRCAAHNKLYVIWLGMSAQSPRLYDQYPQQRAESAIQFDKDMEPIWEQQQWYNVTTIHWMNFTKRAQTSDGVHYLTETNYFRAQYLLQLAQLMKQEQITFHVGN
ncbi:expressed unknown protein [Seminavis robusta]|uniref:Uncharacterized protein n=1 Tax=Seminavis robusta TaxID=568900 RepID=A0A9N8E989_9STRA|nr:expressed unknown protein [Seminavis robusta]|eukprot:Sro649_g181280.1 n/a (466) ;mRNA; f:43726-45123